MLFYLDLFSQSSALVTKAVWLRGPTPFSFIMTHGSGSYFLQIACYFFLQVSHDVKIFHLALKIFDNKRDKRFGRCSLLLKPTLKTALDLYLIGSALRCTWEPPLTFRQKRHRKQQSRLFLRCCIFLQKLSWEPGEFEKRILACGHCSFHCINL